MRWLCLSLLMLIGCCLFQEKKQAVQQRTGQGMLVIEGNPALPQACQVCQMGDDGAKDDRSKQKTLPKNEERSNKKLFPQTGEQSNDFKLLGIVILIGTLLLIFMIYRLKNKK